MNMIRSMVALLVLGMVVPSAAASGQEAGEGDAGGEAAAEETVRDAEVALEPASPTNVYGDSMPHPTVTLNTSAGDIRIELFPEDAPASVENFLAYVEGGHYDGLIFHRVMPNFMIQAGGHLPDMTPKDATRPEIRNESDNGLHNLRGTVAMARTPEPHSARAQFFINLVDNPNLDHSGTDGGWGYAVFGRVIVGMDVVDDIARQPTGNAAGAQNVPREAIIIETAKRGDDM
jgi:cyclophilin family peptidyl-prolyl cis-trans isomerase